MDNESAPATPEPTASTAPPLDGPATQRAEQMVDEMAVRVGRWTSMAGHALVRWGARVREEAEDVWAEAQSLRRRDKP